MSKNTLANIFSRLISIILVIISLALLCNLKNRQICSDYNIFYSLVPANPNNELMVLRQGNADAANLVNAGPGRLYAKSACLMEVSSNRILYDKDCFSPLPMASTTKIMTCILAIENGNPDAAVSVSKYAQGMPDVQLNICEGEQYRLGDLLYSLMLESHNDTAVAIAEHIGGSVEGFANLMNEKAASLGCSDTKFVTPNGLDADGHHTTARDLSLIASYAIQNETFRSIIGTPSHSFKELSGKRNFTVNNKDLFLTTYDGAIGIKTGFTGKAGYCFVGAAVRNNMTLVSTVLASGWPPNKSYKWADTKNLMNYGFSNYSIQPLIDGAIPLNPIPVKDADGKSCSFTKELPVKYEQHIYYPLSNADNVTLKINLPEYVTPPINTGDVIGSVSLMLNDTVINETNITSEVSVAKYDYHDIIKFVFDLFLI